MSTSSESEDKAGRPFPIWNIGLGIIFSIAAIGMGVWAFNVGDLTDDRREILRWLLPIASAIAAGAFTGALSVKSKVLWPATVAASGGFAVWLLSTYVLFSTPKAADFALTIFIRDEQGKTIHANGELWLELKNRERWGISDGQSLPRGIPSSWNGKDIRIDCNVDGYEQINPTDPIRITPDKIIEIKFRKTG